MRNKLKKILLTALIILAVTNIWAAEKRVSIGAKFNAGGRYDNLRMCVGSPAGVKGGPIADIMFLTNFKFSEKYSLTINLPFMRPILFGAAFKMLQFEPEVTFEIASNLKNSHQFIIGPSLGISLHYGPDYKSDRDDRGEEFFAVGPLVSTLFAFKLNWPESMKTVVGVRPFYVALFSKDRDYGTVIGGMIEFGLYF